MKQLISFTLLASIAILNVQINHTTSEYMNSKCDNNEDLNTVISYIHSEFPDYEFVDSSFVLPSSTSHFYRDSLVNGTICTSPLFYSYDLNEDGHPEYLTYIFNIEENRRTPIQNDSVYTLDVLLVINQGNTFSHVDKNISFRTGIYKGKSSLLIKENIAFIKPGIYKRAYVFNDSIYIDKPGLVTYSENEASIIILDTNGKFKTIGLYAD